MTFNAKTHHPASEFAQLTRTGAGARDAEIRRRTGSAWIAGGALWVTAGLLYADNGWRFRFSSATWLVADVLLAVGIVGILVLRPHGPSRPARAALVAALVARLVFAIAEVSGLITGTDDTTLLPIAGVLTAVSTVAYGALARWADRRLRAATFLMGLYFFAVMMPLAVTIGEPHALVLAAWGLPTAVIGLTITRWRALDQPAT